MPVRKIPRSFRSVTGIVASTKSDGLAASESTLERDFLILLEFKKDVQKFEVQPVTINWKDSNGSLRRYTPDVLVHYNSFHLAADKRPILFEIKYRAELRCILPSLIPKFKAAAEYAAMHDWRFRVITERSIRTIQLWNARFLLPFRSREPGNNNRQIIENTLDKLGSATPSLLLSTISGNKAYQAELIPALWYLIGTSQIGFNFTEPISMNSYIWKIAV
jgi:TnsA endonuclease N terminal